MSGASAAAGAMQLGGSLIGAYGDYRAGREAKKAADFEAAQYLQQASNVRASGQLAAAEERRKARLLESRARTVAAFGGGGVDKSARDTIKNIAGEGEFRALSGLFETEEKAQELETAALMRRKEGKSAKKAGMYKAFGSLLSTGSSMASSYKFK